jgi:beta-glucosidase
MRTGDSIDPQRTFPAGFTWGTATSAYQIEGAVTEGGRGPSVWDVFSARPGAVRHGDTGAVACDHVHRLAADVALMSDLGVGAYRFSIGWPRVLPAGTGETSAEGLGFYDRLVDHLLDAGIEPFVTLFHWDLPQALEERGGWRNRDCADWFVDYAATMVRRLGDRVSNWSTLNEPWCYAFLGHCSGVHAPGLRDPAAAVAVAHHQLLGHGRATRAMRSLLPSGRFGVVINPAPVVAEEGADVGPDVLRRVDGIRNRWWFDPLLTGTYPDDVLVDLGPLAACVQDGDAAEIAVPIDWLGINYYNDEVVRLRRADDSEPPSPYPGVPEYAPADPPADATDTGWPLTPDGLTRQLLWLRDRYPNLPPLYITENGAAYDDPVVADRCHDERRIRYYAMHLRALHDAMSAGVDVRGYFAWSLLDNFEWAWGYDMRFGLVHVDFATQTRTVRDSGRWYAELCRSNELRSLGPGLSR